MGVTINPEICFECREVLRSAYQFRKQCLHTENLIGTYLKNARCTATSVELYDVLDFLEQKSPPKTVEISSNNQVETNAQKIISDWEDEGSEGSNLELPSISENKQTTGDTKQVVSKILTRTEFLVLDIGTFV